MDQVDDVDFALAAYLDDDVWEVAELTRDHVGDITQLLHALRRFPGDDGAIGMVAVDEDFFILVRVVGHDTQMLLSDVTAATEWELAASVVEFLGLPMPDEDDDEPEPAGDLAMFEDLGLSAQTLGELLDDEDLYPDEILAEVAEALGFDDLFEGLVGDAEPVTSA